MPAYLIAEIEVTDAAAYEEYKKLTPAAIAAYGGRFIVRGGEVETKEGGWKPSRLIVVEFSTLAQARKFYDSPEYAPALAIRVKASNSRVILADGM
ncbi:MAG: DUF1330 domain-containing protein [Betaproteobacteria bacterium]|nr:DUF1330 domain-containing protein [Betaproteobacteria bacterium]